MLGLWGKGGFKAYWKETVALYDNLNVARLTKNETEDSTRPHSVANKLGVNFTHTYDGERVTYYYIVKYLPRYLSLDFKSIIRSDCRGGTVVNFITNFKPHTIDWNSAEMQSRLRVLSRVDEEKSGQEVSAFNMHSVIGDMDRQKWIRDSLGYLATAEIQRGRALLRGSILITITGTMGKRFDMDVKAVEKSIRDVGMKVERVLYDIPAILGHFSPFKKSYSKYAEQNVPIFVLPDEVASRFTSLSQGTQGISGIYMGSDIYSLYPVLKKFKMTSVSAENILITAETGAGKSNAIKLIILQLIARGLYATIMDIEGYEYSYLGNFLSHDKTVKFVNMAEGEGNYVDTLPIIEPTGNKEIDDPAYAFSLNATLSTFATLVSEIPDTDGWVRILVNKAVATTYTDAGITDDKDTWYLSKDLTFKDVYAKFKSFREGNFFEDEDAKKALTKIIATLDSYFAPDGSRKGVFKNRIFLSDLVSADVVICSFGMAGKSVDAVDKIQLALMQLGAAQISHQRSIFSFLQGRYNCKVWEEFQRWGNFPNSDATINVAMTGGRKLGDINFILTNKLSDLLYSNKFNLLENITSVMVGAINDKKVREDFCQRRSLMHLLPELDLIANAKKPDPEAKSDDPTNKTHEDPFAYAFMLALDNTKFGVTKFLVHPEIAESNILKTGVDESKRKGA